MRTEKQSPYSKITLRKKVIVLQSERWDSKEIIVFDYHERNAWERYVGQGWKELGIVEVKFDMSDGIRQNLMEFALKAKSAEGRLRNSVVPVDAYRKKLEDELDRIRSVERDLETLKGEMLSKISDFRIKELRE